MKKYRIEIIEESGKDVVNIEGCSGIEKYTDNEICIGTSEKKFTVFGSELSMPVYSNGNMCISGKIENISVLRIKKDSRR